MGKHQTSQPSATNAEKRHAARYDLRLPVELTFTRDGSTATIRAATKDVSDQGAFVITEQLLPAGTKVSLELELSVDRLLKMIGSDGAVRVVTDGTVIRNEHHGLAVSFAKSVTFRSQS